MFFSRAILAGLVLLGCLADARYLVQRDSTFDGRPELFADIQPRQSSNNDGPTCRRICGSCGSSCSSATVSKRNLIHLVTSNNTALDERSSEHEESRHLLKRTLRNVRQTNIGAFLRAKINALVSTRDNDKTNLINLAYSAPSNDYTFATLKRFEDFNANVLNIGTGGLEGCTVLTVVSRRAVYMGHFFETLAFDPDGTKSPDAAFQQNCLNLITGQGQTWRTRGDSLDPSLFTGDNGPAFAFIMTPRQNQVNPTEDNPSPPVPGPDTQLYAERIGQLSDTLRGLMPDVWILYYNYIAINVPKQTQQYQGKALFEYDPNADGNNHADFRLWYEQNSETGRGTGLFT
ncbi:hypothetical protein F4818DRAFT_416515 [Hypoxylon cercidicola]|nr:hypothetical protein F4818DRAFT_416515 [Hypoxylon cercidicola]